MAIAINGSGTITGISAGGLPDDCITTADIAAGAVTQAKRSEQLTLGTVQASTSGTSIDFTGIPSWVKRITVMFNGVSTSGTSVVQIQIGSGSVSTSGYAATTSYSSGAGSYLYATSGFVVDVSNTVGGTFFRSGLLQLSLIGSNTWIASGNVSSGSVGQISTACAGNSPALSGALDRVRITTVNGTDTFDAGSINILYE